MDKITVENVIFVALPMNHENTICSTDRKKIIDVVCKLERVYDIQHTVFLAVGLSLTSQCLVYYLLSLLKSRYFEWFEFFFQVIIAF